MSAIGSTSAATGPTDWVTERFGVQITGDPDARWELSDLLILGLRRNRRRAHLLVSTVLGKHIPTPPEQVRGAADALGDAVIGVLGAQDGARSTVIGFAETATGLGHCVAERISAQVYLHSTRRQVGDAQVHGTFEEGHSHATTHLLQPSDAALLRIDPGAPLVLVDDEISTGSTAIRAISALHALAPRDRYVVASLVDMRTDAHRAESERFAAEVGVRIDHVSLAQGEITLPDSLVDDVWALTAPELNPVGMRGSVTEVTLDWPADLPDGGRHGFLRTDTAAFHAAVTAAAGQLAPALAADRDVVVLGHEELMYLPLCLAERLSAAGVATRYQTTTRSPAHVRDEAGYPLRRGFTFTAPESDPGTPRFVYNVRAADAPADAPLPQVVLVIDSPADTDLLRADGGVLDVLTAAGHDVCVAIVPATTPTALAGRTLPLETEGVV
ncbi:phosphoribosyltransferase family protein [Gordonia sp. NB41Y]|uniref:phosphoribosyltransferase family protein n=1 Tax=Gordonia sp. NB41Y TaxID=875808 RepID=UPI0006B21CC5|nr:phosphoribosyltransferase family protein [Gordonia sp. NB41Y]EMP11021.2 phosphoribosyltransferase [Gordonia sp. NB41Y]WLP88602.1 phosphoribosyltransferase family protein [Gordonia sp. NB41Y]